MTQYNKKVFPKQYSRRHAFFVHQCLITLLLTGFGWAQTVLAASQTPASEGQQIVGTAQSIADESHTFWVLGPLINVHTGPGRGYPVHYTLEKQDQVTLRRQSTDWIEIQHQSVEGWIHRDDLSRIIDGQGRRLTHQPAGSNAGQWFLSLTSGTLDSALTNTASLGYELSDQLSVSLLGSHTTEKYLQGRHFLGQIAVNFGSFNLLQQPMSPYVSMGYGIFNADSLISGMKNFDHLYTNIGIRTPVFGQVLGTLEFGQHLILVPGATNIHADGFRIGFMTYF